jgi:hypothetical protein
MVEEMLTEGNFTNPAEHGLILNSAVGPKAM